MFMYFMVVCFIALYVSYCVFVCCVVFMEQCHCHDCAERQSCVHCCADQNAFP